MEDETQRTSVDLTPEGQVRVHYERRTSGLEMGGQLVFEADKTAWLVDYLIRAANDELTATIVNDSPPDHFRVYTAGGHRYDDINVNVHNTREEQAPHGKLYVLTAMTRDVARNLAEQLSVYITP